jgi:hypothetical protein
VNIVGGVKWPKKGRMVALLGCPAQIDIVKTLSNPVGRYSLGDFIWTFVVMAFFLIMNGEYWYKDSGADLLIRVNKHKYFVYLPRSN